MSVDCGNTKTPSKHRKLCNATLSQLAYPGEGNPNFPWEKSHRDNTVVKKNKVGGAEKFALALGVESLDLLFSLSSGRVHVSEPSIGEETPSLGLNISSCVLTKTALAIILSLRTNKSL